MRNNNKTPGEKVRENGGAVPSIQPHEFIRGVVVFLTILQPRRGCIYSRRARCNSSAVGGREGDHVYPTNEFVGLSKLNSSAIPAGCMHFSPAPRPE